MSPDFDRIIAQERQVLASIQQQGDKIIPDFKRSIAAYVRELAIQLLKSYFKHKPDVTRGLGAEKQEVLKAEFTGILDSLPDHTSKRLDDSQIWLHRVEIPDQALSDMTYSYQFEKRSNKAMDDAIRDLIGLVGSLLMKYGFVEIGKDFTWRMTAAGIPQYANDLPSRNMEHYPALNKLMEKYKNLLIEYVYTIQNIYKAEQGKRSEQMD
jgi:hypothetical protein